MGTRRGRVVVIQRSGRRGLRGGCKRGGGSVGNRRTGERRLLGKFGLLKESGVFGHGGGIVRCLGGSSHVRKLLGGCSLALIFGYPLEAEQTATGWFAVSGCFPLLGLSLLGHSRTHGRCNNKGARNGRRRG